MEFQVPYSLAIDSEFKMKNLKLILSLIIVLFLYGCTTNTVTDEKTFIKAMEEANISSRSLRIVFKKNIRIKLSAPIFYTGKSPLVIEGNGATIDGSNTGEFVLDDGLSATSDDASLVFNTAASIEINNLKIKNSAARGILISIPEDSQGDDINVLLKQVTILNSALFGLHIDDNADEFDDGQLGSEIGINLALIDSSFIANGIGAIDFDGIRIDERGKGGITIKIRNTHINRNGGDGIELDEAGSGDVIVDIKDVTLSNNGFYNVADWDDGFDIDESDGGDINVRMENVQVNGNKDEGLDFDEAGIGSVLLSLLKVDVSNNTDEGIKIDEKNKGNIEGFFSAISVDNNKDDGLQILETGIGVIDIQLSNVRARGNEKYGISVRQKKNKDEIKLIEKSGRLKANDVILTNNKQGDVIDVKNVVLVPYPLM